MSEDTLDNLKERINERQQDLANVLTALVTTANKDSDWGKVLKVATIVLGAMAATRDVADKLDPADKFPTGSRAIVFTYTILALLITVIGGVAAAFRFETRAADLKLLATECNSHRREIDSLLPNVEICPPDKQIEEAGKIIKLQGDRLKEMEEKAAKLNMNIVRKVRKLQTKSAQASP